MDLSSTELIIMIDYHQKFPLLLMNQWTIYHPQCCQLAGGTFSESKYQESLQNAPSSPLGSAFRSAVGRNNLYELSAPIWTAISYENFFSSGYILQWILIKKGITHLLHYLDDFIFVFKSLEEADGNDSVHFCQSGGSTRAFKAGRPSKVFNILRH